MNYKQNHCCHNPISTKNIKIPTKYLLFFLKKCTKYLPFLQKNEKNTYLAYFISNHTPPCIHVSMHPLVCICQADAHMHNIKVVTKVPYE